MWLRLKREVVHRAVFSLAWWYRDSVVGRVLAMSRTNSGRDARQGVSHLPLPTVRLLSVTVVAMVADVSMELLDFKRTAASQSRTRWRLKWRRLLNAPAKSPRCQ